MVNFMNIASKIVRALPKTEGAAGKITLGRTQLEALGKQDKKAGELIRKALKGIEDPKLDVAYKAESNYAIAGMRLRDGKQVLNQGAVSITNPGTSKAVVKYRASADKGKALYANGFLDSKGSADIGDSALSLTLKNGKRTFDTHIGDATRHHIEFDDHKLAKYPGITAGIKNGIIPAQENVNQVMKKVRQVLRGRADRHAETGLNKFSTKKYGQVCNAPDTNIVKNPM